MGVCFLIQFYCLICDVVHGRNTWRYGGLPGKPGASVLDFFSRGVFISFP